MPSRWLERLLNKKVKLSKYGDDAQAWDTCAIGEAHKDFPNIVLLICDGLEPKDRYLGALGIAFGEAVGANQRPKAINIYHAIQRRIKTLIRKKKGV